MGKGRDSKAAKKKREERRGETRAHGEAKAEKNLGKKEKRQANKKDEDDLDALLAEFKAMQSTTTEVKEKIVPPPSPRSNATFTAHPTKDEILLYGGEHYDGKVNTFFSELFRYSPKKNEWKLVSTPNAPPPRSSHQTVAVPSDGGKLFVFGGEFSSSNQAQFHHYRDFWSLDLSTFAWEQIPAKSGPSARSGHRMVHAGGYLVVFGGFFDNLREVKYYNDLFLFDLSLYKWTRVTPEPGAPVPSPRSGFQLCVDPVGGVEQAGLVLLYGGYFKKQVKMQQFDSHKDKSQVEELSDTGVEYRDLWSFDVGLKKWDTLKKSGTPPSSRSGFAMCLHKRRLIVFGGVHDEDTPDGDGLLSTFYNDLHAYSLDAGKWHELSVSKAKKASGAGKKASTSTAADEHDDGDDDVADLLMIDAGGRRRNRNRGDDDNSDDESGKSAGKRRAGITEAGAKESPGATAVAGEDTASKDGAAAVPPASADVVAPPLPSESMAAGSEAVTEPCARMKACVALRGNTMYAYGGLVEPEEAQELTLNDLWALDLAKLDAWACLYEGEEHAKALVVESDDDDDDDDEDGEDGESDSESDSDSTSSEETSRKQTIGGVAIS